MGDAGMSGYMVGSDAKSHPSRGLRSCFSDRIHAPHSSNGVSAAAAAGLDAAVTYERAGARRSFAIKRDGSLAAGSDPLLREPLPVPWRWVYRFRPFDAEGVVHCRH